MNKYIKFQKNMYTFDNYLKTALNGFSNENNCIFIIDKNFHVYVQMKNKKIWIGDARPNDLTSFYLQF